MPESSPAVPLKGKEALRRRSREGIVARTPIRGTKEMGSGGEGLRSRKKSGSVPQKALGGVYS